MAELAPLTVCVRRSGVKRPGCLLISTLDSFRSEWLRAVGSTREIPLQQAAEACRRRWRSTRGRQYPTGEVSRSMWATRSTSCALAGAEAAGSAARDSAALAARARLGEHLDQHGAALARRRHLARKRDAHAVQPLTGADSQPEAQPIDSGHGRLIGGFAREMAGVSDERVGVIAIHVV